MRTIIQDRVSHQFIEGPMQHGQIKSSFQKGTDEKTANRADINNSNEIEESADDIDIPYYEAYERYD